MSQVDSQTSRPLEGVRVVDLCEGKGEAVGRYLAELGADVVLVETSAGRTAPDRAAADAARLRRIVSHARKQTVTLDLQAEAGRDLLLQMAARADILLESFAPGHLDRLGIGVEVLHGINPRLVVLSFTDFGQTGPYRNWSATNATHLAMAGVLCRSGLPGRTPLLPPGRLAYESAGIQAAWCTLLAHQNSLQTSVGDHVDFSVFESTAQVLDPGLGVTGSAANGSGAMMAPYGRPDVQFLYPILRCRDGYVRICVLSARQWHGLRRWLGEPEEWQDARYDVMVERFAAWPRIAPAVERRIARLGAADAALQLQEHRVPAAVVATPADVLSDQHFQHRCAFTSIDLPEGRASLASGYVEIDGVRPPAPTAPARAPHLDGGGIGATWGPRPPRPGRIAGARLDHGARRSPLAGLRVLDLGVIVAGAETGRILADQGADVVKVENRAFPDGGRQAGAGVRLSLSTALGHRGKRSLGLDLRSAEGKRLFLRLVRQADIVLSNFKPGTMASLGLDHATLSAVNPRIISVDSSAFGPTGPRAGSMGYGPIVRASAGLTWAWRYADAENSYSDAVTIFPDHLAARVAATAALALVIRRARTGRGGTVSVSQAEVILNVFAEEYFDESLHPGTFETREPTRGTNAAVGVFPCAGDDEWCVVEVASDEQFKRLATAIGAGDLVDGQVPVGGAPRDRLMDALAAWTSSRSPDEVAAVLQTASVAAAAMKRLPQLLDDPHLRDRRFITYLDQPQFDHELPTENAPCHSLHLADPQIRPAPTAGQHTREIARELLDLDDAEIDELIASRVLELEEHDPSMEVSVGV